MNKIVKISTLCFGILAFACNPENDLSDASLPNDDLLTQQNEVSNLSLASLESLSADYQQFLENVAGIPDFVASTPLQALSIGTFLSNNREIGGPSGLVPLDAENFGNFDNFNFDYQLEITTSTNVDSLAFGAIPLPTFFAGLTNSASNISGARYVDYSLSVEDIRLSKLTSTNLKQYIAVEQPNNFSSDALVYGVYIANLVVSYSVLDETREAQRVSSGALSEVLAGAQNVEKSSQVREGYSSAIRSTEPVTIGYLIRSLTPGITTPQNIRVDETNRGSLSVQWDPVPSASYYNVYWSTIRPSQIPPLQSEISEGKVFRQSVRTGTDTEIQIDSNANRYYFGVTSFVTGNESESSDIRIYDLDGGLSASAFGPGLPEPFGNDPVVTKNSGNTKFDFHGCNRDIASIDCFLVVTNMGVEATITINRGSTLIFDNNSEQYEIDRSGINMGNNQGYSMDLLNNVPVKLRLRFAPVIPGIEFLPILRISHTNARVSNTVEFSNIEFFAKR